MKNNGSRGKSGLADDAGGTVKVQPQVQSQVQPQVQPRKCLDKEKGKKYNLKASFLMTHKRN